MNKELVKYARRLSEISGDIIMKYFRTTLQVSTKADLSPVTIADQLAEEKMREDIMREFPDHGIIGEESGTYNENAEYKWILDPIDGTKSFISGVPLFGTLIALTKNDQPIIGIINLPVLKEFLIGDNLSAELNDIPVRMRKCEYLEDAVLLCTDYLHIKTYQDIERFNILTEKIKYFRTWGDCYGYYLLASGYADIMIDPQMSLWDKAAIIPVIKGAGGMISDFKGGDALNGTSIIAAGPGVHSEVISILNN